MLNLLLIAIMHKIIAIILVKVSPPLGSNCSAIGVLEEDELNGPATILLLDAQWEPVTQWGKLKQSRGSRQRCSTKLLTSYFRMQHWAELFIRS